MQYVVPIWGGSEYLLNFLLDNSRNAHYWKITQNLHWGIRNQQYDILLDYVDTLQTEG